MSSVVSPFELTGPLKKIPAVGPLLLSVAERALALQRLPNIHRQLDGSNFASPARFAQKLLDLGILCLREVPVIHPYGPELIWNR